MVAITVDSTEARRAWSHKGIDIAERSPQPRARHWLGSIYNNLGWDHHGSDEFEQAWTCSTRPWPRACKRVTPSRSPSRVGVWLAAHALLDA